MLWKTHKSVNDLENEINIADFQKTISEKRKNVRICVIDDKKFSPLENLQRNNYNIIHFDDINSIDVLKDFDIILCDLLGVGRSLNPKLQGAHIIKETKKIFPEKYVVAYTGGTSSDLIQSSISTANYYTQKDTSIEDWCDLLDNIIRDMLNPIVVWKALRHRLLDSGISPYDLALIEDQYARSIKSGDSNISNSLTAKADAIKVNGDIRAVIQSLTASVLFQMIIAAL